MHSHPAAAALLARPANKAQPEMVSLYSTWCDSRSSVDGTKTLWLLTETERGRALALEELPRRVLDHFVSLEEIAEFVAALGYPKAAKCIGELLPEGAIGRSADLGEILAVEFVEELLDYTVPIRRLRYKDHRDMPMRGEDVIGVARGDEDQLELLKGEAKSARSLSQGTVESARAKLEADHGRPSAQGLMFVARQLIGSEDPDRKELGREILQAAGDQEISEDRLAHLLFTLSGNAVEDVLSADLDGADGKHAQFSANVRIRGHGDFVAAVYDGVSEEVETLGDG